MTHFGIFFNQTLTRYKILFQNPTLCKNFNLVSFFLENETNVQRIVFVIFPQESFFCTMLGIL